MILLVECQLCEADLELELSDVVREPTLMVCPNCGAKADPDVVEAAAAALDEALTLLSRIRRRFRVEFTLDSDDLECDDDEIYDEEDSLWTNDVEEEDEAD